MSELTTCNYCTLQDIKRRADERGATVSLSKDEYGWTVVQCSDKSKPSAWLMKLTDHCVC